ncbi:MAG TPA: hypothetical protein VIL37_17300 [Natronosporangium sp.]
MTPDVAGLVKELQAAFRGAGLRDHSWLERAKQYGDQLSTLAGIDDLDPPATATDKLIDWIRQAIENYDDVFETILCVVAGIHPEARHDTLGAREDWLTGFVKRASTTVAPEPVSKRTVQRRVKEILERFARDRLAASVRAEAARPRGYVVRRHKATLRMDLEVPQVTEEQVVEVTNDKLEVIVRLVSVPHDTELTGTCAVDVLEGGTLRQIDRVPGELDLLCLHIEPSRVLRVGERHRIKIRYRLALPEPLFAVDPHVRYERAILEVRFNPQRPPKEVRRLVAATPWQRGEPLPIERNGRYREWFSGLAPGLLYGFRWDY